MTFVSLKSDSSRRHVLENCILLAGASKSLYTVKLECAGQLSPRILYNFNVETIAGAVL